MTAIAQDVLAGRALWAAEQGDAVAYLNALPEACCHLCVTSPPYWQLRRYENAEGQLGLEATPEEFVANLVGVFRSVKRVLRDDGVCVVNLGDSFSSQGGAGQQRHWDGREKNTETQSLRQQCEYGLPAGNLLGMPYRVALAMQADGWILRGEVIWHKTSPMPESLSGWRWEKCWRKAKVGGRGGNGHKRMLANETPCNVGGQAVAEWHPCPGCPRCEKSAGLVLRKGSWRPTRAHEFVFLFAKGPGYYGDGDAVRTAFAEEPSGWLRSGSGKTCFGVDGPSMPGDDAKPSSTLGTRPHPAGANLRDVLVFPSAPFKGQHYAVYPPSLPETFVKAFTSAHGVCAKCGAPWARVVERKFYGDNRLTSRGQDAVEGKNQWRKMEDIEGGYSPPQTLSWRATCPCNADIAGAVVLDPFLGSGTSGLVARELGRRFIGCDLSPEYVAMARQRIGGAAPLFDRPVAVVNETPPLFTEAP